MIELITRLKFLSDEHLSRLGSRLHGMGITPNMVSVLGLIFIVIAGWFLYEETILIALVFIVLGGGADVLDGIIARSAQVVTLRGGFLDSLIDRYADIILFGSILVGGWLEGISILDHEWEPLSNVAGEIWALGALSGALLTSYARAASERLGVKMEGIGLVERPERIGILFLFLLLDHVTLALFLLTILGHLTVIQRGMYFWNHAESTPDTETGDRRSEDGGTEGAEDTAERDKKK